MSVCLECNSQAGQLKEGRPVAPKHDQSERAKGLVKEHGCCARILQETSGLFISGAIDDLYHPETIFDRSRVSGDHVAKRFHKFHVLLPGEMLMLIAVALDTD